MKKLIVPILIIAGFCSFPFSASGEDEEDAQQKSFGQSISDGYHSLKDSLSQMMGGYSGDTETDSRIYMKHYREDLSDYHKALQEARADYRRARLDDQKAYLEHHNALPMQEDIDSDSGPLR